jgi:hypothetical protein
MNSSLFPRKRNQKIVKKRFRNILEIFFSDKENYRDSYGLFFIPLRTLILCLYVMQFPDNYVGGLIIV